MRSSGFLDDKLPLKMEAVGWDRDEGRSSGSSGTGGGSSGWGARVPGAAFTIDSLLAPRPPRPPLAPPALRLHQLAAAASGFHAAHDFFGE